LLWNTCVGGMSEAPEGGARLSGHVHRLSGYRATLRRGLRAQALAVAILAAHFFIGTLYSVAVPMWEASDETGHFAFVKYLARERRLPPPGQDIIQWYDESHQPPLYYILAALATSWIDTDDGLEPEINPHAFTGKGMGGVNIAIHSDREAFPYGGTALAMHVARLVSVAISTAVVAVTYFIGRFLFPQNEAIALGAMALNAFWPQFLFLGAVVTNDILVPLFSSLVIFFLLRIAYKPGSWKDILWLGLCLVGGLATKLSAWSLIPLAVVVLILIAIRRVPVRARWWSLPLMWLCFSGIWWWLRGITVPSAWIKMMPRSNDVRNFLSFLQHPLLEAARLPWDVLPRAFKYCFLTIWASFGWDNIGVEEWVYHIFVLLCLVGVAGLIAFMARSGKTGRRFGVLILIFGVFAVFAPPTAITVMRNPTFLRGRIVSGAIPLLSLLIFLGLSQLIRQRYTKLLAVAVGGGLCILALIIPFRYIAPAYARPPILSMLDIQNIEHPMQVNFANKIELLGYDIDPEEPRVREALVVTLYWRALSEMEENYTVGAHLMGPEYESYGGRDSYPAGGNYATSLWRDGDIIRDIYWLRIPRDFRAPSTGKVEVTLYLHATGERLALVNPEGAREGDSVLLGPFGVVTREEPEYSIPYPLHYDLGDALALVGYHVPDVITGTLPATLYWQGLGKTEQNYTVFVHVFDEEGNLVGQDDQEPRGGLYPTSIWGEGRIVEDRHDITISHAGSPGHHRLRIVVGMYLLETMERLPVFDADGTHVPHDEIVIPHHLQIMGESGL
jgi:4-amino-4-deoxy-L-arabinose transferase-like glycosyltransferase